MTEPKNLKLNIYQLRNHVVLDFEGQNHGAVFTPDDAIRFANGLIKVARSLGSLKHVIDE